MQHLNELVEKAKLAIKAASDQIAIVFTSNFSVGVNLVFKLLENDDVHISRSGLRFWIKR